MPKTIAISGKGGAGKTTLSAMIIRALSEMPSSTVLAVDGDPNSCLGITLGVEPVGTVSQIREQTRAKKPETGGMDRVHSFEYGIQQMLTESKGFDLLTMGQPEGPDCYCAANNLLRQFLDKLSNSYDFVVVDNEAGMEHLSRRTTNNVDFLFILADPTPIGQVTAKRIFQLAKTLPINVEKMGILWNRTDALHQLDGMEIFGSIPFDQAVLDSSMQGKNVFEIDSKSIAFSAIKQIINNLIKS